MDDLTVQVQRKRTGFKLGKMSFHDYFWNCLRHVASSKGIEVDKAKVEIISKLPSSKTIREVRSFLEHARFYRRFIKDFSVISRPLCNLLIQDTHFEWTKDC